MTKTKRYFVIAVILLFFLFLVPAITSQEETQEICAVYITGLGCPNCAITDPALLSEYTAEYPKLIVIEYEIYRQGENNTETANQYFDSYLPQVRAGIPFLIFNKNTSGLGRFEVLDGKNIINVLDSNPCPLADGSSVEFKSLDIVNLPGKPTIWTKNRILISEGSGGDGNNEALKKLLTTNNITTALKELEELYEQIEPRTIEISEKKIEFDQAIKINNWIFQWKSELPVDDEEELRKNWYWTIPFILMVILILIYLSLKKKIPVEEFGKRNLFIISIAILTLVGLFMLAKAVPVEALTKMGGALPLPIFTLIIALVDGFNPCNIFVLTLLLGFLTTASHSRKKIYTIGYTFIAVVFIIYFIFMAFWLNVFKYIGFITPLRIAIGIIALGAGIINCKELFAFRKGITLMIRECDKGPLVRRIRKMKDIIVSGSIPTLIGASILLAVFASLAELPCTAGFPVIYTGILTGKVLANNFSYYLYLLLYNLIYITPLAVIIGIFGWTFKRKEITKRQMALIKFIGGAVMVLLGIILLFRPELIGLAINHP